MNPIVNPQAYVYLKQSFVRHKETKPFQSLMVWSIALLVIASFPACSSSPEQTEEESGRMKRLEAEAYTKLGTKHLYNVWNWDSAAFALRKSLEIDSQLASTHAHYAWYLVLEKKWEQAKEEMKKARELDPHNATWPLWHGWICASEHNFDCAQTHTSRALELDPDNSDALMVLGKTAYLRGDLASASQFLKAAGKDSLQEAKRAMGHAIAGETAEADTLIDLLIQRANHRDYFLLAEIYFIQGDRDQAVHWVEEAVRNRHSYSPWIPDLPILKLMMDDPRIQKIVEGLALPG